MRVLVTGDREWDDEEPMLEVLMKLFEIAPHTIVVHGDCRGADRMFARLAVEIGFPTPEGHPADWNKHHRAAGPIRNRYMITESRRRAELDGHDLRMAFAFHNNIEASKGTRDMMTALKKAGIPCLLRTSKI